MALKWDQKDKLAWFLKQKIQRNYQVDIVNRLQTFAADNADFMLCEYAKLDHAELAPQLNYPLYLLKSKNWQAHKPSVLITAGVHGYETSGILGAIDFLETQASRYNKNFNIVVVPCVSPWGYETINRWDPETIDPNRSFSKNGKSQGSLALMQAIADLQTTWLVHFDLHETTNSDEHEFRPALAARDGLSYIESHIPDGFYLVGDTENPQPDFQKAMIDAVQKVTHIAPADAQGRIIGEPITQKGVINYACEKLALCTGFTKATFNSTTEVYPDSNRICSATCIKAQVVAIQSGLEYLLKIK
ncbi:hypothetical protein PCNPT3_05825 [Psychromonas sp. CNPT3]|uniref:M14 family metallopeptidase n=1 Tax=Psychromonas sp. CNPT3 TaxID=314282 RepID=UPI0002C0AF8A|nr:M14 family metallocarboxypeptidase [Psychromonas sp. CNPT3]AGH81107.1 hypothetical protein PCNPT3_05825 [Psychromonas sp. CNPT3]